MAVLNPTTLETHPAGGDVNGIVIGNWEVLNMIFAAGTTPSDIRYKLLAMGLLKLSEAEINALANGLLLKWNSTDKKFETTTEIAVTDIEADVAEVGELTVTGAATLPIYTVAQLNTGTFASDHPNAIVLCSDGDAGARCLAVSDGATWKRVSLGADISET